MKHAGFYASAFELIACAAAGIGGRLARSANTTRSIDTSAIAACIAAFCVASAVAKHATADESLAASKPQVSFVNDIRPLLEARCISCHGPEKQEGGLRLDTRAGALAGGDRGPALVPGNIDQSLLVQAITFKDPDLQMPPKQRLTDQEIATLTDWVRAGAAWPASVAVLFEDDPHFLASLTNGNGRVRLLNEGAFSGRAALGMTPLQRDSANIPGWKFPIRENPREGEFRHLRLAWKKRGAGSVMLELATNGHWPDAKSPAGRYVAGPNTTGWAAKSVGDAAPGEWTVVSFDLWQDLGDTTLTGLAPTCDGGEEAFFDAILLGPTMESLDAYRPFPTESPVASVEYGPAIIDARNPIRRLFRGERLDLWSLRSPVEPPHSGNSVGRATDAFPGIDTFLRARLAAEQLDLAPPADPRTLIRRLTFDLHGLPPSPDEVAEFVANPSPRSYADLVERLLASPRYGERQARLWLDVVRYADTNGYERDEFRPLMWQYRDYVIRAFQQDMPFDQFIREQLAGDQLVSGPPQTPEDADRLIATGFLRLGQWDSTASIFQEETRLRAEVMADLTNTTASAFLGLTFGCCQCHDHKYDPFSQADHFRLRAFFAGATPRDDLPISLAGEQAEIDTHNAALDAQVAPLKAELEKLPQDATKRREELAAQIQKFDQQRRSARRALGVSESSAPESTHILYQGDYASPREPVEPGFPMVLGASPTDFPNRRLALADWIAAPHNPWTARVIVNRVWQQHFGVGLVATPNDFGHSGARPSHSELLDALARDFVEHGWSIKRLHRQIVISDAYRQSSHVAWPASIADKRRALFGVQTVRRLDAETVRDTLLAVSGLLRPYGPGKPLWPPVPDELLQAQPAILEAEKGGDGGRMQGWYADPIAETDVRSIFLVRKRCLPIPFLQAFDLPDTTVSCARRDTTVVAPQALMLLNSPESLRYAQGLASRLWTDDRPLPMDDEPGRKALVESLFQLALARRANAEEQAMAHDLLRRHAAHYANRPTERPADRRALTDLCRAVLNLNEFLYVD